MQAEKKPVRPRRSTTGRGPNGALDAIDESILVELRKDGRISNRDLAKIVGVNEVTVRARLQAMEKNRAMQIVAIRDLSAMGYEYLSAVGILVKGRAVDEVGADLARIPQILTVNQTIGIYDLEIQVVAHDIDEMGDLLNNVIANTPGVQKLAPSLAIKVLKYESKWAPLS